MSPRHIVLAVTLAATLAATVWLGKEEGADDAADVVAAAPRRAAAVAATSAAAPMPSQASAPIAAPTEPAARFAIGGPDLFPTQSWKPPPPPPPVVVVPPPPPPQAPPLPFRYVGRWDGGEGETFMLSQGDRVVTVRVGQNQAQWRLDSVDAGGLNFTYLPLQQQRQLRFGP